MTIQDPGPDRHIEVVAIPLWQRFVAGGAGPDLTLAEAAAALGVSVQTARRLIRQGKLQARKTSSGRYLVSPSLATAAAPQYADNAISDLWQQLKRISAQLQETRGQRDALIAELEAMQSKLEVALQPDPRNPTLLSFARSEARAMIGARDEIQALIVKARRKSRRRLWLWRLSA